MATDDDSDESDDSAPLLRFRASGVGMWLFLTVGLLLVFRACGVSLW